MPPQTQTIALAALLAAAKLWRASEHLKLSLVPSQSHGMGFATPSVRPRRRSGVAMHLPQQPAMCALQFA